MFVALAPALYLLDAGGSVIIEGIDVYAIVFQTASVHSRSAAIVWTNHGWGPHP